MIRVILPAMVWLAATTACAFADEPSQEELKKIPQYKRTLKGEDAKKVEELEKQARSSRDIKVMIKLLNEIVAIREQKQGKDHFETVTIALKTRNVEAISNMSIKETKELSVLDEENKEAVRKMEDGLYFQAQAQFEYCLEKSVALFGSENRRTADTHEKLAKSLTLRGRPFIATTHYRKSLDIKVRLLGKHPDVAKCYTELAEILEFVGDMNEAAQYRKRALDIAHDCFGEGNPRTAIFVHGLAKNIAASGDHKNALPYFLNAVKIGDSLGTEVLTYAYDLANTLSLLHDYEKADTHYGTIIMICDEDKLNNTYLLPLVYGGRALNLDRQGKHARASVMYKAADNLLDEYLKSRKFVDKYSNFKRADTIQILLNYSWNLHLQGSHKESLRIAGKAMQLYDTERLLLADGIYRSQLNISDPRTALACIMSGKNQVEAWDLLELSLARGTLDQMANSTLSINEAAEYWKLKKDVSESQRKYDIALKKHKELLIEHQRFELSLPKNARQSPDYKEYEKLAKDLETVSAAQVELEHYAREYAEWKLKVLDEKLSIRQVASTEAIQQAIPSDGALVMWIDMSLYDAVQEHYVVVVRNTGLPHWERLPGTGEKAKWTHEDTELSRKFRAALANSATQQGEIDRLVKQMVTQRVAPALKHLQGVKTIYTIPVNEMAGVPLELLISDKVVSYVPSGTFLVRAKEKKPLAGQQMLALGDPIFAIPGEKVVAPKPLPPGGVLITQVIPGGAASNVPLNPGDVILKYGNTQINDLDALEKAIDANKNEKSIPITIWREDSDKPILRNIEPGRLGVVLDQDPAPVAIGNRRKPSVLLASLARGGDWKDLPGTRVETKRLRQLVGDSCVVLNDSDASEQRLEEMRKSGELAKFRYLHFATHGAGNWVNAWESSLILSQDKLPKDTLPKVGEPFLNGQLSAREVLEFWKLDAELVTLSACETAIGKASSSDGSLGFAQAFLKAGSRSVCLSLWKVDDVATALLMDRFYQNLLGKRNGLKAPMSKAAALDEAKRWLRNLSGEEALALTATITKGVARGDRGTGAIINPIDPNKVVKDSKPFAHPKYWAAFVLIGDPN